MASNAFGNLFKITTWGESHGKAIGVIIDGCPAGVVLSEEDINQELRWRSPGRSIYTSPRQEIDRAEILSGVFEGKTTGTPISIIIWNRDAQSGTYEPLKNLLRPGHANYTYLQKYGHFDYRGGGRASARETACRVAAGAVAKKILSDHGVTCLAFLKKIENIEGQVRLSDITEDPKKFQFDTRQSPLFCPCRQTEVDMRAVIEKTKIRGDSVGGVVEAIGLNVPAGWGDPVYEKLEANLAKAMLSLPASKGFEIGSGFRAADMHGSEHNDEFYKDETGVKSHTNHAGGTLGGISTGMPLVMRVAFKPTSSIKLEQRTVDLQGKEKTFNLPNEARHDPCVAIRAVPVVEAMLALVLVDAMLLNQSARHST
jgi:chorismate synthase